VRAGYRTRRARCPADRDGPTPFWEPAPSPPPPCPLEPEPPQKRPTPAATCPTPAEPPPHPATRAVVASSHTSCHRVVCEEACHFSTPSCAHTRVYQGLERVNKETRCTAKESSLKWPVCAPVVRKCALGNSTWTRLSTIA